MFAMFENNYMKSNTDKCHLIVSGYKDEQVWESIMMLNFLGLLLIEI